MERLMLLKSIIDCAIDGIITIDRHGKEESISPAGLNIFGYSEQEVIGNNISILMPEPDRSKHGYIEHHQRTREEVMTGKGRQVRGLRKDGTTFPFRSGGREVKCDDRVIYARIIYDLSKEKAAEEHLSKYAVWLEAIVEDHTTSPKKMLTELSEAKEAVTLSPVKEKEFNKNQMKTRFVSMASHEFRSPSSSLQLSAILAQKYMQLNETAQDVRNLRKTKSSVGSFNSILNDIPSLEKVETDVIKANMCQFDFGSFSYEIVEEVQLIAKTNQKIIYQHTGTEGDVYLDPALLRNCFLNLISNAIKDSGENTSSYFSTYIAESSYAITVKDNGIGIPEAVQKTLFEPFFRAHNTRVIAGTGLGLNILRSYISLMNG